MVQEHKNEGECRTHYKTFFQCLFHHSLEALSKLNLSDNDLASEWYNYMGEADNRHKFYKDVVRKCEVRQTMTYVPLNRTEVCLLQSSPGNQSVLKDLVDKLQVHSASKIPMVIYIDEAHELTRSCRGRTRLEIMSSVMSEFCNKELFFLLLSTQPSFLAPIREALAASKWARWTMGAPAPITETPFDCFWDDPIKSGALHMKDLSTLEYVTKWGRPLYVIYVLISCFTHLSLYLVGGLW